MDHSFTGIGRVLHLGEAKVDDFQLVVFVQHDVLRFYVSVNNALRVHVANCSKELLHVLLSILFRKYLVLRTFDFFEEFTAIDVFHDKINLALVLIGLIVFDDVSMIQPRKILHFLPDLFHLIVEVLSFKDFDRHLIGTVVYVLGQIDLAIRSTAQDVGVFRVVII